MGRLSTSDIAVALTTNVTRKAINQKACYIISWNVNHWLLQLLPLVPEAC